MEATVDKLETMFQKADADLDYLSRKLDSEFATDQEVQGAEGVNKPTPAKMLQKIGEIKKEYGEIVKEAEAIKNAQKEAMDFFRNELMMVCETLGRLQQNVGMEQAPPPEDMARVTEILGIEMPAGAGGTAGEDPQQPTEEPTNLTSHNSQVKTAAPAKLETPEAKEPLPQTESPLERRASSSEFIEIDESEFQSTSTLVRGRVKLSDLNHTYRLLWTHFKEEKNAKALSPQEMHKMGLRVTGQTGEAKLKVLRALKLLTLSNKGEVKLV